jgi:hypothetical protein
LTADQQQAVSALAERLGLDERIAQWRNQLYSRHSRPLPTLCLDDFSAIPFLDVPGAEQYQHRARVRARQGDVYAAVCPTTPDYEAYCRDFLGLGEIEVLQPEPRGGAMEIARACLEGPSFDLLANRARDAGGLVVHPYMAIEAVWELARRLGEAAGAPVEVLGPPPPVTWIANDKGLLSELVETLLGSDWIVETYQDADPEQLAVHLRDLAGRHREVALKRLRCASATGNKVFSAAWVRKAPHLLVIEEVRKFLERTEWDGREGVLAVTWEQTQLSPSTQLWIPLPGEGPPLLEGIYEQILTGEERTFVGSRPTTLPDAVNQALADAGLILARGLQQLGYVGRCSFDHLVLGDVEGDFTLRFVECNGRWGGTSIPMTLVDRLVKGPRPAYRAQDVVHPELEGVAFADLRARLAGELYDPRTGRGRFVLYNPGPLAEVGKIDVIAFGETQAEAETAMEIDLPRCLGLPT